MIRLATSPEQTSANTVHSVKALFRLNNITDSIACSIPAPKPEPEPNPEPDAAVNARCFDITPADWDTLFYAVTARLQACSGASTSEQLSEDVPEHLLGAPASVRATVRECVVSLNHLHAALIHERQQRRQPQ